MRNAVIGVVLLILAMGGGYYLFRSESQHQSELSRSGQAIDVESKALEAKSSGELKVKLYFYDPAAVAAGGDALVEEERSIFETQDPVLSARQIVNEVLQGRGSDEPSVFPSDARVRQIYLLEDGTAVVDLPKEAVDQLAGGITSELGAIQSITRSLRENVTQIKRVRFLIDGKERPTFSGHVSIRDSFR